MQLFHILDLPDLANWLDKGSLSDDDKTLARRLKEQMLSQQGMRPLPSRDQPVDGTTDSELPHVCGTVAPQQQHYGDKLTSIGRNQVAPETA